MQPAHACRPTPAKPGMGRHAGQALGRKNRDRPEEGYAMFEALLMAGLLVSVPASLPV
jgi:hypothetical protein